MTILSTGDSSVSDRQTESGKRGGIMRMASVMTASLRRHFLHHPEDTESMTRVYNRNLRAKKSNRVNMTIQSDQLDDGRMFGAEYEPDYLAWRKEAKRGLGYENGKRF